MKRILRNYIMNIPGWRTQRKIVVIESDDWGSIRMPSKEIFEKCLKEEYPVDKISYECYDSLASEEDLNFLFEVLSSIKDKDGNHPVFTANCVVANPDFEKIKASNFSSYHYELITDTFRKYPQHKKNFEIWQQGLANKIFYPQFHAREHINVSYFMNALQIKDANAHFGFSNRMPGCISKGSNQGGNKYLEALVYNSTEDKKQKLKIILEGLDLFENIFNYKSESLIPPNYTWSPDFDFPVFKKGVKYFQGTRKMKEPIPHGKLKFHTHLLGQANQYGQIYLVRNAFFEPSMFRLKIKDPVAQCLSNIEIAFRLMKPAIISSHRLNYVGFINKNNRDQNLHYLKNLMRKAISRWPEIEFLTTCELAATIAQKNR